MKMLLRFVFALLVVPGLSVADPGMPGAAPKTYFDPATLDAKAILPTPPPANSDDTTKEIEFILQRQADRTPEQVARIQSEAHYNVFALGNAAGSWLSKENIDKMPLTTGLLASVMETAKPIVTAAKGDFNRPAPFTANSRIFTAIEHPTGSSYPSGTTTRAVLDSLVLAELAPDNAQAIIARGQQIGDDRVTAGVEYPSDVKAGQMLARAVFQRLKDDPQFQADLKAAKAEVAGQIRMGK
jgi:acid phosphatase (class A)